MPGRGRGAALLKAIAKLKEDPAGSPVAADNVQILDPVKKSTDELVKDTANVLEIKEKKALTVGLFC